jgi:hypothetical protein
VLSSRRSAGAKRPPSREAKVHIGGWFTPEWAIQLKVMAAEESRTVQDLMAESLNLLFRSRGVKAIGPSKMPAVRETGPTSLLESLAGRAISCTIIFGELTNHAPGLHAHSGEQTAPKSSFEQRQWLDSVMADSSLSRSTLALAGVLAQRCQNSGRCYALVSDLAKQLGTSERTVQRSRRDLQTFGYIAVNERRGAHDRKNRPNEWVLLSPLAPRPSAKTIGRS